MKNMKLLSLLLLVATTQIKSSDFNTFMDRCQESVKYSGHLLDAARGEAQGSYEDAQDMISDMKGMLSVYKYLDKSAKPITQQNFTEALSQYISKFGACSPIGGNLGKMRDALGGQLYNITGKNADKSIKNSEELADIIDRAKSSLDAPILVSINGKNIDLRSMNVK